MNFNFSHKRIGLIALTIICLNSTAFAGVLTCNDVHLAGVGQQWKPAPAWQTNSTFIGVTDLAPVTDQGQLGFCWLFGTTGNLINRYEQRTGQPADVSILYWSYFHWLHQALTAVVDPTQASVDEGGFMDNAVNLMRQHGAITQTEWIKMGGTVDLQLASKVAIEQPQMQAIMNKVHLQKTLLLQLLRPPLKQSASEKTQKNYYAKLFANKDFQIGVNDILIEKGKSETALSYENLATLRQLLTAREIPNRLVNQTQVQEIIARFDEDAKKQMTRFFNQMYFKSNESPINQKVNLPSAIARAFEMFPELKQNVINFNVGVDRSAKPRIEASPDISFFDISDNQAARLATALIKSNTPVVLMYDHQDDFVDVIDKQHPEYSGTMSIERLKQYPESTYLTRRQRQSPGVVYEPGGHLVNLVGAWLNPKASPAQIAKGNEIRAFRMQNTWSTKAGQKGYFEMDRGYFGAFVQGISLFSSDLDKPEVIKVLGADTVAKIKTYFANHESGQI